MKKCFIVGTLAFSLIATTVYAFNDESSNYNNKLVNNYHNCQYHNGNEVCPYYENKDVRDIVNNIKEINKLSNCDLSVGQKLLVPNV